MSQQTIKQQARRTAREMAEKRRKEREERERRVIDLAECPWPWQSPHWWPSEVPVGGQVKVPTLCSCHP